MASAVVWATVVNLGRRAAKKFHLRPHGARLSFEPFRLQRNLTIDGRCWVKRGLIQIRVHRTGRPTQSLTSSTIMATLAHELAHLPGKGHGSLAHGKEHGELSRQIAEWMRSEGAAVSRVLHSGSSNAGMPASPNRPLYKRAWKRPKPRRRREN